MRRAKGGQVGLLSRRLVGTYDPIQLHAGLDAPLLFRRAGGRALILVDSALRLEATGSDATLTATSEAGEILLPRIARHLADQLVGRDELSINLRFPRCDDSDQAVRITVPSALDVIRAMVFGLEPLDSDEPFAIATLGLIGFDYIDMVEALPQRPARNFPDLLFHLAETLVVVEPNGAARVLALSLGSDDPDEAHRQHHLAAERLARTAERCAAARPTPESAVARDVRAVADVEDLAFAAVVARLKQHIAAGDIFQAVPSRTFRAPCTDPMAAFRRLVAADPSAYQFAFASAHGLLFGASPETAVEVRREGPERIVSVRPIAGTRPRGATAGEDDRNEADLRLDAKEVAEHMMLVDLSRNDVARVSRPGTRRVSKLLGVERFARVMHLVSTIEGELADGMDAVDAIRACLNVGTLSGAPKLRAIELIRAVEDSARGPYGGAIGWIAGDGSMDSAVVIRSALVRDGIAEVRAGAGVVADSEPLAEVAETRAKASAVLAALGATA